MKQFDFTKYEKLSKLSEAILGVLDPLNDVAAGTDDRLSLDTLISDGTNELFIFYASAKEAALEYDVFDIIDVTATYELDNFGEVYLFHNNNFNPCSLVNAFVRYGLEGLLYPILAEYDADLDISDTLSPEAAEYIIEEVQRLLDHHDGDIVTLILEDVFK